MMILARYLDTHNLSQRAFAAIVACSPSYLSEILGGIKKPSLEMAFKIERATSGEVPAVSWVPDGNAYAPAANPPQENEVSRAG